MNLDVLILVPSSLAIAVLGLVVFMRNRSDVSNQRFAGLAASLVMWTVFNYLSDHSHSHDLLFTRLAFIGGLLSVRSLVVFIAGFPNKALPVSKAIMVPHAVATIICAPLMLSPYFIAGVTNDSINTSFAYPLFIAYVVYSLVLFVVIARKQYKSASTYNQKRQASIVYRSIAVYSLLAGTSNILIPLLANNWYSSRVGPLFNLVFVAAVAYSIVRYRLFDVKLMVVRSIGYFLSLLSITVVSFLLLRELFAVFDRTNISAIAQTNLTVLVMMGLVIFFQPFKKLIVKLVGRLFYRDAYDLQVLLDEFNDAITSTIILEELLERSEGVVGKFIRPQFTAIIVNDDLSGGTTVIPRDQSGIWLKNVATVDAWFKRNNEKMLITDGLEPGHEMKHFLQDQNIGVLANFSSDTTSIGSGYIVLGYKKSGDAYNTQDINALDIIRNELSVVVQNALRFIQSEKFNETLQTKIKEVTADYESVNRQMYAKNFQLARINTTLTLLRSIDLITLQSRPKMGDLAGEISKTMIGSLSYACVAFFSLNKTHDDYVDFQGWAVSADRADLPGVDTTYEALKRISLPLDGTWLGSGFRNLTIDLATMKSSVPMDMEPATKKALESLRDKLKVGSVYLTKLSSRQSLVGVMVVGLNAPEPRVDEIELIERLGEPIGVAIDNKLLLDENQRVLRRLSAANDKLKQMDETKDEFISMASHQLRTPLTSVKGYVSMVLEGDAGPLSDMQKKLLDQAFVSSQRMVYLIADLLNVSRLRTGKFVIEPSSVNLADVVESEVTQLQGTARDRMLELTYDKPKDFPVLLLDETKTRQVIMNFMDNAIYYTPHGGHIHVALKETERMIEFTVTDDGMGVPRQEQPHLFSKFFRAGNARKARPDGTGLGLYMAKKVVVAQGGAIIFKSRVGKGSTFGFTFAKSKLKVPAHKPSETTVAPTTT